MNHLQTPDHRRVRVAPEDDAGGQGNAWGGVARMV